MLLPKITREIIIKKYNNPYEYENGIGILPRTNVVSININDKKMIEPIFIPRCDQVYYNPRNPNKSNISVTLKSGKILKLSKDDLFQFMNKLGKSMGVQNIRIKMLHEIIY